MGKLSERSNRAGSTKRSGTRPRVLRQITYNYGNSCDICKAVAKKNNPIWSYLNKYGRMESRCKKHLKRSSTRSGPRPEAVTR